MNYEYLKPYYLYNVTNKPYLINDYSNEFELFLDVKQIMEKDKNQRLTIVKKSIKGDEIIRCIRDIVDYINYEYDLYGPFPRVNIDDRKKVR